MKEEVSSDEHQEHYSSHRDVEISPTLVLILGAACRPGGTNITRQKIGITRITRLGQKSPCDYIKISRDTMV